jgi:hypothetical protein
MRGKRETFFLFTFLRGEMMKYANGSGSERMDLCQEIDLSLYEWYAEPKNRLANKKIPELLANQSQVDEGKRIMMYDNGGKRHHVWRVVSFDCTAAILDILRQKDSDIELAVFHRRAGCGGGVVEFRFEVIGIVPPKK